MQWHSQGPCEPIPPGREIGNNSSKEPLPLMETVNIQAQTVGHQNTVRPLLWPSNKTKQSPPPERPRLPSLSSMFGYLDQQPPPPPPPTSQYANDDSGLPAMFQLKQSLASDSSKSFPKLAQSPMLAPTPPSLPSLPAPSVHQNDHPIQHHQRPSPSHHHLSHSNVPPTPYEHKYFPSTSLHSPVPSHQHHQHRSTLVGQQHNKSVGRSSHLPPAPMIQASLPPAGSMGAPGPVPPHQQNHFHHPQSLPMLVGMPARGPYPPEPVHVSSVSTAPQQQQQRDDLSAEDEQNVAISVYLADSDVVPQLLENGRYQCPLCPRNYKYAKHVRRHIINHTNIYPYSCPRCNALFRRKDAQRRHMQRIHPDIPPHTYMNSRLAPDSDDKSDESR